VLLVPGTTITGDYFDTMAARLRADGFTPVVYEPADLLTGSLADGAAKLGEVIDARLRATGESRLHVVAECNGGVATRYYLQVLGGASKVDQVVTFVSAHHGTWESPVGSWVSGFQSLKDITPGSAFLGKLNAAPFPKGLRFTSIYSCNDELMVPYTTSVVDGATNVNFCDHYIGHFDGFTDALVYGRILSALRGEGDAAPTRY
jgi:triacylglycerol lipase